MPRILIIGLTGLNHLASGWYHVAATVSDINLRDNHQSWVI